MLNNKIQDKNLLNSRKPKYKPMDKFAFLLIYIFFLPLANIYLNEELETEIGLENALHVTVFKEYNGGQISLLVQTSAF